MKLDIGDKVKVRIGLNYYITSPEIYNFWGLGEWDGVEAKINAIDYSEEQDVTLIYVKRENPSRSDLTQIPIIFRGKNMKQATIPLEDGVWLEKA
jgi:hypothetical protein